MKNRIISKTIYKKSTTRFGRIIVVTGARQTGKTTLVKNIFKEYPYISIEDPVAVEDYKKLTASQWKTIYPRAILDEIQKEPQLIESLKSVYDQFEDPRYVLLGSSQILLLKNVKESLAGRCHVVEMYPLTLPEMLTSSWNDSIELSYFQKVLKDKIPEIVSLRLDPEFAKKKKTFDTYLKFGGYPALSDTTLSDEDKWDWLKNYVRTYLERDIRDLAELRRLEPFTKVKKLFALSTAQLTNYSQLAVEAGVSSKTVQRFLEYMCISYQTVVLQAWGRNRKKRLVKSPKIHFLDIGVMRAVIQKREALNGHEFETAIVAEIYKQVKAISQDVSFYHLRTSDGREIDLLLELETGYIAIEIKMSETVRGVDAKHLKKIDEILDKPVIHKFVISNDLQIRDLGDGVVGIPAVQFLT